MSNLDKQQAAIILLGYRKPEKRPTCKQCKYIKERESEHVDRMWHNVCTRLAEITEFPVSEDGECDHFQQK